jgi:TolB-like protein
MDSYEFGKFRLDVSTRALLCEGRPVSLAAKAFDLLLLLVRKRGALVKKEELMKELWPDRKVELNNLTVNMAALRKALGDAKRHPDYIETVPKQGYRFCAQLRAVEALDSARDDEDTVADIATAGTVKLAVLPLTNYGDDPNVNYLADGLTEALINSLSKLTNLRVIARNTVFRYKGSDISPQTFGQLLKVDAVLVGRMFQKGKQLLTSWELIRTINGAQIWAGQYNRLLTDLFVVQDEIASQVAEKLRLKLNSAQIKHLGKRYTRNSEAYQFYLKGRYFWNSRTEDGLRKAIDYFQSAIDLDRHYALAYVGLADCYNSLSNFGIVRPNEGCPKAKAAAIRALELDEGLAEAHASLAHISMRYDYDWATTEREYLRALELSPNYAMAHHWYSVFLSAMERHADAVAESRRALQLDPLSLIINAVLGIHFYFARQYDQAITQYLQLLEIEPKFVVASASLAEAYLHNGMHREALRQMETTHELTANSVLTLTTLGYIYAAVNMRAAAREILEELLERSKREFISPYEIAKIFIALEEFDDAFVWLEKAFEERMGDLMYLRVLPELDPLRPEPRFTGLMKRIGFA